MKMSFSSFFFSPSFTEWMEENVVSYLVRAWLLAKRIFMLKYLQTPFLLLISG